MSTTGTKKNRMLEIFFRAMKGENISVKKLADEYNVSVKSISRDLGDIKNFLCENRELIAIIKMMIGCRAFSKMEILDMITKLKNFTSFNDRNMLEKIITKEMYSHSSHVETVVALNKVDC